MPLGASVQSGWITMNCQRQDRRRGDPESPEQFPASHTARRTYGLFTANPFGLRSLGQGKDSSFTLKKGESITLRHRVIFHLGDEKAAKIAEAR